MGGRTVRRLLLVLVAVVVVLVVADRVGVAVAEHAAADTIQSSQHLSQRPAVDIAGFPFLTQLLTGQFGEITVTATDVPIDSGGALLDLSRVVVVLHSLTVSRDFSGFHARTATATAVVTYAELSRRLGVGVRYGGAGRVVATRAVDVGGRLRSGTVRARPDLVRGALTFSDVSVDAPAALGDLASGVLSRTFDLAVPLQGIPFQVRVRSLRAEPAGVVIGLAGRDLSFSS
jgi:hypothetical protein